MAEFTPISAQQFNTLISQTDSIESLLNSINSIVSNDVGFNLPVYDYISLSYTGANLTEVVYKTGGSGGTTVATLTLVYSGSNIISVTKT